MGGSEFDGVDVGRARPGEPVPDPVSEEFDVVGEFAAEPRDVALEGAHPVLGEVVRPDQFRQPVRRDSGPRVQAQCGEHHPLASAPEDRPVHPGCTQHPDHAAEAMHLRCRSEETCSPCRRPPRFP